MIGRTAPKNPIGRPAPFPSSSMGGLTTWSLQRGALMSGLIVTPNVGHLRQPTLVYFLFR